MLGEVEVFDAQADALHQAQAAAVEEFSHEHVIGRNLPEESLDFVFGEDDRQVRGLPGADEVNSFINVLLQDVTVQEENGREGLGLGGGGDMAVDGQVSEEGGDLGRAHVFGVAELVEVNKAFDPIYVGVFGANRVVFDADGGAELVEEFGRFGIHGVAF